MMELVKVLVVFLLLTNVFCQEMDADTWSEENKLTNSARIQDILVRITRKPGPCQHPRLSGRNDSGKTQTARKSHRFETFVGLMGKRSFEQRGEILPTRAIRDF